MTAPESNPEQVQLAISNDGSDGGGRYEEGRNRALPNKRQKTKALTSPILPKESGQQQKQRKKRKTCNRCHRPFPQTCLCESLPEIPIPLTTTEVVVLQHPLEIKNHKAASHRSLPLLELCLDSSSLFLRTGRRFGKDSLGAEIVTKIWGNNDAETKKGSTYLPVLVFPKINVETAVDDSKETEVKPSRYHEDEPSVLSLQDLVERWKETNTKTANRTKILLLVLDATWKHAREMHIANIRADQYPPHMLRLALQPDDFRGDFVSGRFRLRGKASKTGYKQQRMNNDDTAIDETWMSTAECIAWILSNLEAGNKRKDGDLGVSGEGLTTSPSLYEILMKPLDFMVAKWNSYRTKKGNNNNREKNKKDTKAAPS